MPRKSTATKPKVTVSKTAEKKPTKKLTIKLRSDLAKAGIEFFDKFSQQQIFGTKEYVVGDSDFIMRNMADSEELAEKKDVPFYKV